MMFSAEPIRLPLINHYKCQTIRLVSNKAPPKIGSRSKVYWRQRTTPKDSWFCMKCGMVMDCHNMGYEKLYYKVPKSCRCDVNTEFAGKHWTSDELKQHSEIAFNKFIGVVEITDVFQIEIGNDFIKTPKDTPEEIARLDGFRDLNHMLKWFTMQYDLSQPSQFIVIRFRWCERGQ